MQIEGFRRSCLFESLPSDWIVMLDVEALLFQVVFVDNTNRIDHVENFVCRHGEQCFGQFILSIVAMTRKKMHVRRRLRSRSVCISLTSKSTILSRLPSLVIEKSRIRDRGENNHLPRRTGYRGWTSWTARRVHTRSMYRSLGFMFSK